MCQNLMGEEHEMGFSKSFTISHRQANRLNGALIEDGNNVSIFLDERPLEVQGKGTNMSNFEDFNWGAQAH